MAYGALSRKQKDLLLLLGSYGDEDWHPMTTFDLFEASKFMYEEVAADDEDGSSWRWRGWGREGVAATMRLLESRGLVQRRPWVSHRYPVVMSGAQRLPARYEWTFTNAGLEVLDRLVAVEA